MSQAPSSLSEALAGAANTELGVTFVGVGGEERSLTWRQVLQRAQSAAGALAALGVRPEDRVAIVLRTSPEFLDAFFGTLLAGAVPVPLYPPVRLGRLDEYHRSTSRMLEAVGAKILVTDARIRLLLGRTVAIHRPKLGTALAEELSAAEESPPPVEPAHLGLIQFSSGSTREPRPVALSQRALLAQCGILKQVLADHGPWPALGVSWLPLYHDMGLIGGLLMGAYYPGQLVLIRPEDFLARPSIWLKAISRHHGTVSPAPNFAYALCVKRVSASEMEGVDLSSWRYALNGAEPVSSRSMARFVERFGPHGFDPRSMVPVYGLSEAALAVSFSPRRSPPKCATLPSGDGAGAPIVSVGRRVPGFEIQVRDEEGRPLGDLQKGRVFVRGPSLMEGYFGLPEETAAVLSEGWLDTGDLGFVDQGELHVCGRAKEVVILRGANYHPQPFEECLEGIAGLRPGCAVAVGFIPEGESEELLILAEAISTDPRLVDRIKVAILEGTGIRPHTVALLAPGTLPRTSSGKMRRHEAKERYLTGTLLPPKRMTGWGLSAEVIRSGLLFAKARLPKFSRP